MGARISIVWDYDTAIGQINSSYPYAYNEQRLIDEIENVETILSLASEHGIPMTFACCGFAAEPGHYPFHVPEQIQRIHRAGHEIASHSWRHEWFPYLQQRQVSRSLERSKQILEECIGEPGAVRGFVPPFNRPMSWYARGALSLGDHAFRPGHVGADLGTLLPIVRAQGYDWCRIVCRPLWSRMRPGDHERAWFSAHGLTCVPMHIGGFDEKAQAVLARAIERSVGVVVVGHPSGLSRQGSKNVDRLSDFLQKVACERDASRLVPLTVWGQIQAATS